MGMESVKVKGWGRSSSWPRNLFTRSGSRRFYIRIDWPSDVRPFVGGQQQHRKSLGTADYREACAMLRTALGEFQARCNRLRIENGKEAREARQRTQFLTLAYSNELSGGLPPPDSEGTDAALSKIDKLEDELGNSLLGFDAFVWNEQAKDADRISLPRHWDEPIRELLRELLRGDKLAVQPAPANDQDIDGHSLTAILELLQREREFKPRTALEYRTVIDRFEEVNGRKPVEEITKVDGTRFKQKLLELGLAPASKVKQIGFLKSLLNYAADSLMIPANPLAGLKADGGRKSSKGSTEREDFSVSDLHALFGREQKGSQHWWVMRLALFTGMRLGEIIQLTAKDVFQSGDNRFISVNAEDQKA